MTASRSTSIATAAAPGVRVVDIWDGNIEEEGELDVVRYLGRGRRTVDRWETFPDTE